MGLPWRSSGSEPALPMQGHRFDPWPGGAKILHAVWWGKINKISDKDILYSTGTYSYYYIIILTIKMLNHYVICLKLI